MKRKIKWVNVLKDVILGSCSLTLGLGIFSNGPLSFQIKVCYLLIEMLNRYLNVCVIDHYTPNVWVTSLKLVYVNKKY